MPQLMGMPGTVDVAAAQFAQPADLDHWSILSIDEHRIGRRFNVL